MKFLKASITFILSIIIATSAAAIAGAVAKAETNSINVTLYKDKNLDVIKDDGNYSYSAKVTGNKKAVIVDTEYGDTYTGFMIIGNKLTGSKRATVKIIKTNNITDKSETVKTYKISVKKPKVKKLATIKLSKGQKMVGAIKNDFCRECKLKVRNTKIVKPNGGCPDINTDRDVQLLTFNAKKKGSTTADVYIKNTKVGKVKIKVGAYKPYVDSKKKTSPSNTIPTAEPRITTASRSICATTITASSTSSHTRQIQNTSHTIRTTFIPLQSTKPAAQLSRSATKTKSSPR